MQIKVIFIIIIVFFIITRSLNNSDNFANTVYSANDNNLKNLIYQIYQVNVIAIQNLVGVAKQLYTNNYLIIPGDVTTDHKINLSANLNLNKMTNWKTDTNILHSWNIKTDSNDLVFTSSKNSSEILRLKTDKVIIDTLKTNTIKQLSTQQIKIIGSFESKNATQKMNINDTDIKFTSIKSASGPLTLSAGTNSLKISDTDIKLKSLTPSLDVPLTFKSGNNKIEINNTDIVFTGPVTLNSDVIFNSTICNQPFLYGIYTPFTACPTNLTTAQIGIYNDIISSSDMISSYNFPSLWGISGLGLLTTEVFNDNKDIFIYRTYRIQDKIYGCSNLSDIFNTFKPIKPDKARTHIWYDLIY